MVDEPLTRLVKLETENARLRRAISWLRDDLGTGYCETHPDVDPLRAWGCPDCLIEALAKQRALASALRTLGRLCVEAPDQEATDDDVARWCRDMVAAAAHSARLVGPPELGERSHEEPHQ